MEEMQLSELLQTSLNAGSMAAIAWYLLHVFRASIDEVRGEIAKLNANMSAVLEHMRKHDDMASRVERIEQALSPTCKRSSG